MFSFQVLDQHIFLTINYGCLIGLFFSFLSEWYFLALTTTGALVQQTYSAYKTIKTCFSQDSPFTAAYDPIFQSDPDSE